MKAIGLIRVSTKAQEFESQSIKVKEAMLRDGFTEDDIILIEDKESGSKLSEEERSGLNKLKNLINNEQVSAVYAYEISRISRKASVVYSIRDYLLANQVNLVVLNPYFKLLTDTGEISPQSNLFFGLFSSMSENENYLRTARCMRGKEKKKADGKLASGIVKFGYALDNEKRPIPHPEHSKVVQEIYERYAALESSGSIGKDLWIRGAIPSTGKLQTYQTYVSSILRDKRYAGLEPDSVYPPLVSKEIFNKCQEIHEKKPEYYKRKSCTKEVYPLQGYIYTSDGYRLVPSITNNRYLKMRSNGTADPISLNMKAVHELSKRVINKYLSSGVIEADRQEQIKKLQEQLETANAKLRGIGPRMDEIDKENDFINKRIVKGKMSEDLGDGMIQENINMKKDLEDTRQALIYEINSLNNKLSYYINPMFNENEQYQVKTDDELKEAVQKYLSKVTVKKIGFSRYTLTYHFKDSIVLEGSFYSNRLGVEYQI